MLWLLPSVNIICLIVKFVKHNTVFADVQEEIDVTD